MASQNQNESQSNIPSLCQLEFMRSVTPFDTLAAQELETLVSRMEIAFFPNNRPPLSLLKRFIVEKSGEHKNKIDLKMRGLTPVVDAARVLSLDLGIKTQNTFERLSAINRKGVIDDSLHADLKEAYEFIVYLQISRHLDALAKGKGPDNFLDPGSLNSLQRKIWLSPPESCYRRHVYVPQYPFPTASQILRHQI